MFTDEDLTPCPVPGIILGLGMLFFPESPRWLIDHGGEEEALEILADLHGGGDPNNELVQFEYEEIKAQVYFERTEGAKAYSDLLKPGIFRRVILGCSLQMWSQLSGMNIMMFGLKLRVAISSVLTLGTNQVLYCLRLPGCWFNGTPRQFDCFFSPIRTECDVHE